MTSSVNRQNDPTEVRHQLAAIMFTDICGYTAMVAKDEQQALQLLRQSRKVHMDAIDTHHGKWIKELGDGVMAQFPTAQEAVRCACDIQKAAGKLGLRLRIGLHLGDITVENEDVYGDGVNIASRIEGIADPGSIYISNSVYTAIRSVRDLETFRIGAVKLKNVGEPLVVHAVTGEGLVTPDQGKISKMTSEEQLSSLAVLPFKHLSEDVQEQYFVDGMHDALIGELSQINALRVISRTSSMRYRDTDKTVPQIAAELGIDGLIEATVFRQNGEVSIQVQLIRAFPEEDHIWAGSYQQEVKNVLSLYNDVIKDVVSNLEAQLTHSEEKHLEDADEIDPKAYEAYLHGVFYWEKLSIDDLEMALRYFERSQQIAPDFALAYSGMAGVWLAKMTMGQVSTEQAIPQIYRNIRKTRKLDTHNAESYFWSASVIAWSEWDWEGAKEEFDNALALKPSLAIARSYYAHLLSILGDSNQALLQSTTAMELDPFNPLINVLHAMVLNFARRYEDAIAVIDNIMLSDGRNHPIALSTLRSVYHNQARYEDAYLAFRQSYQERADIEAVSVLDEGYSEDGYRQALSKVAELYVERSRDRHVTPWQIATLYTRSGKYEEAIVFLERALEAQDPNIAYIGVDPIFDPLRAYPRFHQALKKLHLE